MFVVNKENSMKYDVENTCTENMDRIGGLLAKTDKYTITIVENHKKN